MATPLTWIQAQARDSRPNTSLDVIPVHDVSADHFVGFQYQVDPCVFPGTVPQDCYIQVGPAVGTEKTFGDASVDLTTEVFGLYAGIECFLNGGINEFRDVATRVLENGEYHGVDVVLQAAIGALATATTPTSGDNIVEVIGILEQTLATNVPGQGYIYLSPYLATLAVSESLLIRNLDGTLETYLGTPVVILSVGGTALGTAYASGPVNLWRSPINLVDAPAWETNMGRALAERLYSISVECGAWQTTLGVL